MGRRFVVSDIHGNYLGLKQCLGKVNFDYVEDLLIVNGDVCDGFPHVDECIDEFLKIKNCYTTLGNHDRWSIEWIQSDFTFAPPLWTRQGGSGTIQSYDKYPNGRVPKKHIDFLVAMCPYITISDPDGEIVFCHGGLDPNQRDMSKQSLNILTWDRDLMASAWVKHARNPKYKYAGKKRIFIGHTTTQIYNTTKPLFLCNVVCGDTGAGWDGPLTIINIDTLEWEQSDPARVLYPDFNPRF